MDPEAVARLLIENAELRATVSKTNALVGTLTRRLEESQAEAAAQRKVAEKSQRQVEKMVERLNELTDMLRRFMRARDLPAPEVPPAEDPEDPEDPPPAPSGGTSGSDTPPKGGGVGPEPRERKKKAPGRGGRRKPSASMPGDVVTPAVPDRCPSCDHPRLLAGDTEVSVKYTAVRGFVRKVEIRRAVCACAGCNTPVSAKMPPMPWKNSQFTPELLAFVIYMKFLLLVPLDRLHKTLQTQGVDIPWSSFVYLIERASDLFGPVDGEHWRQLRSGPYMGVDGTGLNVVTPGLGQVWKGYVDVFCRAHLHVFQYSATKHAEVLEGKLRGFKGIVVCDAEFRMDRLFGVDIREANCNAHPRRKFKDAQRVQPVLARTGKGFIDRMYAVEKRAKKLGLTGAALAAFRVGHTRPIAAAFREWLDAVEPPLLQTDPLGKVVRYYRRHFAALTLFIDDPTLPIDNNQAERAFQLHAKLRVNAEFAGSTEGAHRWSTLLGVVTTAKRLGVDVLAYLTWAIERLGTWKSVYNLPASALTPEAYKRACEEAAAVVAKAA